MERDAAENRKRAHTNPKADLVRQWAVEQVLANADKLNGGESFAAIAAADKLATYVLTGELPA